VDYVFSSFGWIDVFLGNHSVTYAASCPLISEPLRHAQVWTGLRHIATFSPCASKGGVARYPTYPFPTTATDFVIMVAVSIYCRRILHAYVFRRRNLRARTEPSGRVLACSCYRRHLIFYNMPAFGLRINAHATGKPDHHTHRPHSHSWTHFVHS